MVMLACQVNEPKAVLRRKSSEVSPFSANTRHLLPARESSLPENAMMDRFEMMTSNSEQVVNRAVDAEKALELGR